VFLNVSTLLKVVLELFGKGFEALVLEERGRYGTLVESFYAWLWAGWCQIGQNSLDENQGCRILPKIWLTKMSTKFYENPKIWLTIAFFWLTNSIFPLVMIKKMGDFSIAGSEALWAAASDLQAIFTVRYRTAFETHHNFICPVTFLLGGAALWMEEACQYNQSIDHFDCSSSSI